MANLSKFLNPDWSIAYNCYEIGHVWTPYCTEASLEMFFNAFGESLKIYGPLYLLSQAFFTRRYDAAAFLETFKSIIRSSTFLSSNALTIILFFCITRTFMGKFYYRVHAYIPTFIGAIMSVMIEKPSRRAALAVYVANIASECLFRIQVDAGTIKPIPRGEVLIFTVSMAILLYLIKRQGYGNDPVSLALRYYLGYGEAGRRLKKQMIEPDTGRLPAELAIEPKNNNEKIVAAPTRKMSKRAQLRSGRHASCKHDLTCVHYATSGFVVPFTVSFGAHVALTLAKRYRLLLKGNRSEVLREVLLNKRSLKFALFFGAFSGIYKAANCLLRRYSNGSKDWHALVAGGLAGPSMLFNPNSTIALYVLWKAIETLYWNEVHKGNFKHPGLTAIIVYGLSVSQIAFCVLLQPKHMRPSYMRFIDQITGHRFHQVNRFALNVLVPDAVVGYEDYFPNLDPERCSNKFLESVLTWLI